MSGSTHTRALPLVKCVGSRSQHGELYGSSGLIVLLTKRIFADRRKQRFPTSVAMDGVCKRASYVRPGHKYIDKNYTGLSRLLILMVFVRKKLTILAAGYHLMGLERTERSQTQGWHVTDATVNPYNWWFINFRILQQRCSLTQRTELNGRSGRVRTDILS